MQTKAKTKAAKPTFNFGAKAAKRRSSKGSERQRSARHSNFKSGSLGSRVDYHSPIPD